MKLKLSPEHQHTGYSSLLCIAVGWLSHISERMADPFFYNIFLNPFFCNIFVCNKHLLGHTSVMCLLTFLHCACSLCFVVCIYGYQWALSKDSVMQVVLVVGATWLCSTSKKIVAIKHKVEKTVDWKIKRRCKVLLVLVERRKLNTFLILMPASHATTIQQQHLAKLRPAKPSKGDHG
jgi:hypothetical protein